MTEKYYNTQVIKDPEPCENIECTEGFTNNDYCDYDHNVIITVKEKCPFCDDYGHKK